MFTRSAITPPEVSRFGWNVGYAEYIVWSWPLQILGTIRAEARDWAEILFFLYGKQRAISPTSGLPNFTKSVHKTWIREAVTPFGINFWKFPRKESFFQKELFGKNLPWLRTSGRDVYEMITNRGKSRRVGEPTECWLSICTVGINSKWFPCPWTVQRAHGEHRVPETLFYEVLYSWRNDDALLIHSLGGAT